MALSILPGALVFIIAAGCRTEPPTAYSGGPVDPARPMTRPVSPPALKGVTVVIDPGHGGQDTGAISGGVLESTLNYRMASVVACLLRSRGARVRFTVRSAALLSNLRAGKREPPLRHPLDARLVFNGAPVRQYADKSPDELYRRAAVTRTLWNELSAEERATGRGVYFLSLHCDKLGNPHWRGARVYCDKRDRRACRFALTLKRRLTAAGMTNSLGGIVIPREYGVLNPRYNMVPERALVEVATISNPRDRHDVQTATWRWRMARILVSAIAECEESGEARSSAATSVAAGPVL